MITLKVSFLLAINSQNTDITVQKKPKRKSKNEKLKKFKSKKGKSKPKINKKREPEIEVEDPNFTSITVENPISYVHVDYDLFGKKFKYSVDVVCWGPVAKIFAKCGEKCCKTATMNDKIWIPVFLEHYLDSIPTEEIRKMLNDVITVSVKIGKNYVGAKAKADKSSVFYLNRLEATDFFPEVYSKKPEGDIDIIRQDIKRFLEKLLTYPTGQEILSWIYSTDQVHAHKIANILSKRLRGDEIVSQDFPEEEKKNHKPKDKNKSKTKKAKKSTKSKSTKSAKKRNKQLDTNQKFDLKIPSYILISDSKMATYQHKNGASKLQEFYILLSSEDILSKNQGIELCPLVVKIRKINNLPIGNLKENGIHKILASCDVPGLLKFDTNPKPVTDTVIFDTSRIIFGSDFADIKILELLQTRKVHIEVFGVKEKLEAEEKRKKKSKRVVYRTVTEKLPLAQAQFDLSPLATTFFLYKEQSQLYNNLHKSLDQQHLPDDFFTMRFTVNETHFAHFEKPPHTPLLTDISLLENGTTLKLEAKFLANAYALAYMRNDSRKSLRRLLVVFFDEDIAKKIVSKILQHNYDFCDHDVLLSNLLLLKTLPRARNPSDDVISGFFVDHSNFFILFVEGFSHGFILNVMYWVSHLDITSARVFYNSRYNFEERLYKLFYNQNGLLCLLMKMSFSEILSKQKFYVGGNVPYRCFRAVQKFDLILKSNTFKTILNQDLLPTEIEFLSFLIEYGLQVQYNEQEENVRSENKK